MASGGGESTLFADALSGADGTAEPRQSVPRPDVFADPTADWVRVPARVAVEVSAATASPVPTAPPRVASPPAGGPTRPTFPPPAPTASARVAPLPRTAPPSGPAFPAPPPRTSPPPVRPGSRVVPAGPPPLRASTTNVVRPRPTAMPRPAPGGPARPTAPASARQVANRRPGGKKSGAGGIIGLLAFLFLFALGSGLLQKLVALIQQYLHR